MLSNGSGIKSGVMQAGILWKRGNWAGSTVGTPSWKFNQSFGQQLLARRYTSPLSQLFLDSHTLLTQTEGGKPVYKPLNSPRGLLIFAEMSNSLGTGELKATLPPCNRRARWGRRGLLTLPGTGGELQPADVTRLLIGWSFPAIMWNWPWLASCK